MQANQSATWAQNLLLAGAVAVVCLGIAFSMAYFGFWMIIPFAGLEVVFVTFCLYWTVKRLSRREVITVDDQSITLEWGYNKPDTSVSLPRSWSRLEYDRPQRPMDVGSLSLKAHGKRYTVGNSLGRDEKSQLHAELKKLLATFSYA